MEAKVIPTPDDENKAKELLGKMFKENPVKITQFCLTLIARDLIKANATNSEISQDLTVNEIRYNVKIKSVIKKIKS